MITQLIFDHALRMRVKSEVADESTRMPVPAAPGEFSSARQGESSGFSTPANHASSESVNTVKERANQVKVKREQIHKDDQSNLVGRLNNLITSDIDNLQNGQIFVMLGTPAISGCNL